MFQLIDASRVKGVVHGIAVLGVTIGYGKPVKLMDAIEIIAELCNVEPQIVFKEEMKGDVKATWADVSKARKLLGWQPRTKLRDGLEAERRWVKQAMEIGLI